VLSIFTVEYTLDSLEKTKDLDARKYSGKEMEKPPENISHREDIVRIQ